MPFIRSDKQLDKLLSNTHQNFEDFVQKGKGVEVGKKTYWKVEVGEGKKAVLVPMSIIEGRTNKLYEHALSSKGTAEDINRTRNIVTKISEERDIGGRFTPTTKKISTFHKFFGISQGAEAKAREARLAGYSRKLEQLSQSLDIHEDIKKELISFIKAHGLNEEIIKMLPTKTLEEMDEILNNLRKSKEAPTIKTMIRPETKPIPSKVLEIRHKDTKALRDAVNKALVIMNKNTKTLEDFVKKQGHDVKLLDKSDLGIQKYLKSKDFNVKYVELQLSESGSVKAVFKKREFWQNRH